MNEIDSKIMEYFDAFIKSKNTDYAAKYHLLLTLFKSVPIPQRRLLFEPYSCIIKSEDDISIEQTQKNEYGKIKEGGYYLLKRDFDILCQETKFAHSAEIECDAILAGITWLKKNWDNSCWQVPGYGLNLCKEIKKATGVLLRSKDGEKQLIVIGLVLNEGEKIEDLPESTIKKSSEDFTVKIDGKEYDIIKKSLTKEGVELRKVRLVNGLSGTNTYYEAIKTDFCWIISGLKYFVPHYEFDEITIFDLLQSNFYALLPNEIGSPDNESPFYKIVHGKATLNDINEAFIIANSPDFDEKVKNALAKKENTKHFSVPRRELDFAHLIREISEKYPSGNMPQNTRNDYKDRVAKIGLSPKEMVNIIERRIKKGKKNFPLLQMTLAEIIGIGSDKYSKLKRHK